MIDTEVNAINYPNFNNMKCPLKEGITNLVTNITLYTFNLFALKLYFERHINMLKTIKNNLRG